MTSAPDLSTDSHVIGPDPSILTVRVDLSDPREWMRGAPVCRELSADHILHIGVADVAAPYRVVRLKQSGAYFLACFGGEGRVLINGQWRVVRAGMGCLLPPRMLNAFHAVDETRWQFCWVRYDTHVSDKPPFNADAPILARFDGGPLRSAITGLHQTCSGEALPTAIRHWLALIQTYVLHFTQRLQNDERLWRLWEKVKADFASDWNDERLAHEAQISPAELTSLCEEQFGRSPSDHVAYLRLRRAAELLMRSDLEIATIGIQIGYPDPADFCRAFHHWMGWPPEEFRAGATRSAIR